ncbi:Putative cyclic nucleotide-gated ion channel 14 [Glycine soja]|nr:Putative cyclic nucleotide-gated ion channel 14 [Glycine soja]
MVLKTHRFSNDGKHTLEPLWEKIDAHKHHEKAFQVYPEFKISNGEKNRMSIKIASLGKLKVFPENHEPRKKRILDPGSDVILEWNRAFLFSCILALFVTCFRTFADVFYLLNMAIKFRTAYVSPNSRVFARGELAMDPRLIARRYLRSEFFLDLVATLPLPQIVIWFIMPAIRSSHADHTNNALVLIVLLQYVPRLYMIFPLRSQIIKATGVVTKTAWTGAAYVLGASWYLLSIERHATCRKSECRNESLPVKCALKYLDCSTLNHDDRTKWVNTTSVFGNCNPENSINFNYGIFGNAVENNVVSSVFKEKYLYCLWWGLQNLSSYGQSLTTSTFVWETAFAILTYLQSITVRLEEWRLKRRDTEEWMSHRQLPQNLRERVRRFVQYKWLATRGVDEETILRGLPTDLRRDIQCHLCLDLVRRVPFFSQMDDQLLDAICERLVSSLSTQGTYIVREGDPVTEMHFIIRGKLESSTTNGGRTGFFNSITLRPALVEVEAFALRAEDLKFVANQFRRLHNKKLQHTFRFYSYHWRTWAACFIQGAWRRFKKRMLAKSLSLRECQSFNHDEEVGDEMEHGEQEHSAVTSNTAQVKQNLGVTILASRFAANTRRGVQKIKDVELPKFQKPEEPDFSVEPYDD